MKPVKVAANVAFTAIVVGACIAGLQSEASAVAKTLVTLGSAGALFVVWKFFPVK